MSRMTTNRTHTKMANDDDGDCVIVDDDTMDGCIYVSAKYDEVTKVFKYEDARTQREARHKAEAYAEQLAAEIGCDWGTNY